MMTSPLQEAGSRVNMGRNSQSLGMGYFTRMPNLTNNSAAVIRHQMDESNHDMVQMLAQTMGTILNPLIEDTTQSNQQMAAHMMRLANFSGVSQPPHRPQREYMVEN